MISLHFSCRRVGRLILLVLWFYFVTDWEGVSLRSTEWKGRGLSRHHLRCSQGLVGSSPRAPYTLEPPLVPTPCIRLMNLHHFKSQLHKFWSFFSSYLFLLLVPYLLLPVKNGIEQGRRFNTSSLSAFPQYWWWYTSQDKMSVISQISPITTDVQPFPYNENSDDHCWVFTIYRNCEL